MFRILLGFYKTVLATQIAVVHNSEVLTISVILIITCLSILLLASTKIVSYN